MEDTTKLINVTGKAISGEWGVEDDDKSGVPILRTTNFTNEGKINYSNVITRKITKKNIGLKYLMKGDIIIEKSGGSDKQPVGRVVYFEGDNNTYLFNNFTGLLRVKNIEVWNPKYIFWSLYAAYRQGKTKLYQNKTTGLHNLKTDVYVKDMQIRNRTKNQQLKIVESLDKVQSISENYRQQLNKLDELIKARFVEMFGDPIKVQPDIQTWSLKSIATVKSSHRIFTKEFVNSGVPFYRGTEISMLAAGNIPKHPYYISRKRYDEIAADDSKPKIGDLLLPSICDKGQLWLVNTDKPFYYKDGRVLCISLNKQKFNPIFFHEYMKLKLKAEYSKLGSGSTFAEFKIFQLKKLKIFIPSMKLQNEFANFVQQVDKSKVAVQKSLDETQKLYDSLMQEYFG